MTPPKKSAGKESHAKAYIIIAVFSLICHFIVASYIYRFGKEAAIDGLISGLYNSMIESTVIAVMVGLAIVYVKKCIDKQNRG